MEYIENKDKVQLLTMNRSRVRLTFSLGVTLLFTAVVLMVTDPVLIISKYCSRAFGPYVREALSAEFPGIYISAYLFNITNADRFQTGLDQKLKVEEVGPFTYQEFRTNQMLEFDHASTSIRYMPNIRTEFIPEKSVGKPEDYNVTLPNLAMLGMASKLSSFSFIPRMGFNLLASRLQSKAIVHLTAKEFLWGYPEPLIKFGNSVIPGLVTFDILGIFDRLWDKKAKYMYEVSADNEDKFSIRTVNGTDGLDFWGHRDPSKQSTCNSFVNTYEGISYPPEMTGDRPIRLYRSILCRILELDFHGAVATPYGVQGLEYRISNRSYSRNKDTECLCREGICEDGISDMSPCFLTLPIVLSNAHFMHAAPSLYERIDGMQPDEEKHGSFFIIEPKIGMAMDTQFSIQVNLYLRDLSFNSEASLFSNMIVPVAYVKITQPPLMENQVHYLNLIYFTGPRILLAVQILLITLGLGLLGHAARALFWMSVNGHRRNICLHTGLREKSSVEVPLMS